MSNKQLLSKSIHQRFLAVALLPLLLIITLLTLFTIESRRTDLINNLIQSGDSSSNYLATVSDFALYSRNNKLLQEIASSALRIPDVAGVAFLNNNSKPVLAAGHFAQDLNSPSADDNQDTETALLAHILRDTPEGTPHRTEQFLYFKKPVFLSGIDVSDYQEESLTEPTGPERVGWIILAIDRANMLDKQKAILTTSALLFLFGLIIAVIFTYYLSLGLISPIQKLTDTIRQMAGGNLNARAETGTDDELAVLAAGINQLAASVAEGKETLEHRIRFATRQLQETLDHLQIKNQELEISRQTAETANQSKSGFLARMSHELRTPITSIQGFIRLLDTTKLAENERHYCQIIDQAALQLLTLIDDILAFSKLQSDTVELAEQPLDLAECVEQVIAMFAPQAQHKGLNLVVDYSPDLSLNRIGDTIRIQQILSNLIANAIKFSDEGGVYLSLKTNDDLDVIIEVRDTGIGIPEAAQAQLFNAFAQADTSISRRYGGTGLGLSIVKSLVDLMNGDIHLKSWEGKGSTFTITLPLMPSAQPDQWQLPP
ncbi:MAG: HAMP domain-containing protein, partial [Gammaproteobacteria bacterium]